MIRFQYAFSRFALRASIRGLSDLKALDEASWPFVSETPSTATDVGLWASAVMGEDSRRGCVCPKVSSPGNLT